MNTTRTSYKSPASHSQSVSTTTHNIPHTNEPIDDHDFDLLLLDISDSAPADPSAEILLDYHAEAETVISTIHRINHTLGGVTLEHIESKAKIWSDVSNEIMWVLDYRAMLLDWCITDLTISNVTYELQNDTQSNIQDQIDAEYFRRKTCPISAQERVVLEPLREVSEDDENSSETPLETLETDLIENNNMHEPFASERDTAHGPDHDFNTTDSFVLLRKYDSYLPIGQEDQIILLKTELDELLMDQQRLYSKIQSYRTIISWINDHENQISIPKLVSDHFLNVTFKYSIYIHSRELHISKIKKGSKHIASFQSTSSNTTNSKQNNYLIFFFKCLNILRYLENVYLSSISPSLPIGIPVSSRSNIQKKSKTHRSASRLSKNRQGLATNCLYHNALRLFGLDHTEIHILLLLPRETPKSSIIYAYLAYLEDLSVEDFCSKHNHTPIPLKINLNSSSFLTTNAQRMLISLKQRMESTPALPFTCADDCDTPRASTSFSCSDDQENSGNTEDMPLFLRLPSQSRDSPVLVKDRSFFPQNLSEQEDSEEELRRKDELILLEQEIKSWEPNISSALQLRKVLQQNPHHPIPADFKRYVAYHDRLTNSLTVVDSLSPQATAYFKSSATTNHPQDPSNEIKNPQIASTNIIAGFFHTLDEVVINSILVYLTKLTLYDEHFLNKKNVREKFCVQVTIMLGKSYPLQSNAFKAEHGTKHYDEPIDDNFCIDNTENFNSPNQSNTLGNAQDTADSRPELTKLDHNRDQSLIITDFVIPIGETLEFSNVSLLRNKLSSIDIGIFGTNPTLYATFALHKGHFLWSSPAIATGEWCVNLVSLNESQNDLSYDSPPEVLTNTSNTPATSGKVGQPSVKINNDVLHISSIILRDKNNALFGEITCDMILDCSWLYKHLLIINILNGYDNDVRKSLAKNTIISRLLYRLHNVSLMPLPPAFRMKYLSFLKQHGVTNYLDHAFFKHQVFPPIFAVEPDATDPHTETARAFQAALSLIEDKETKIDILLQKSGLKLTPALLKGATTLPPFCSLRVLYKEKAQCDDILMGKIPYLHQFVEYTYPIELGPSGDDYGELMYNCEYIRDFNCFRNGSNEIGKQTNEILPNLDNDISCGEIDPLKLIEQCVAEDDDLTRRRGSSYEQSSPHHSNTATYTNNNNRTNKTIVEYIKQLDSRIQSLSHALYEEKSLTTVQYFTMVAKQLKIEAVYFDRFTSFIRWLIIYARFDVAIYFLPFVDWISLRIKWMFEEWCQLSHQIQQEERLVKQQAKNEQKKRDLEQFLQSNIKQSDHEGYYTKEHSVLEQPDAGSSQQQDASPPKQPDADNHSENEANQSNEDPELTFTYNHNQQLIALRPQQETVSEESQNSVDRVEHIAVKDSPDSNSPLAD